jgi:hypothetical protein
MRRLLRLLSPPLLPLLLATALGAQTPDRLLLKSGRTLEGRIELEAVDALQFVDRELGPVRVPHTVLRAVERAGAEPDPLGPMPPAEPGERPATYVRWLDPRGGEGADEGGGLQTGTGRWYHPPTDTTVLMVGVVHVGDPRYFRELQRLLDMCDLVLFEGVGRGDASDEDLARMDAMMRMQLALGGALGLGFQKDHVDYRRDFWVNSDLAFAEVMAELAARGGSLPTDNPLVAGLLRTVLGALGSGGGRREPRLQARLKRQMGPILAQADQLMSRPGMASMRGAIIEFRNEKVIADLERALAEGPKGRRIAAFYGAGHLPDLDRRLLERGLRFEGSAWHTAWRVEDRSTADLLDQRALDAAVRSELEAHGDPGLEVSAWLAHPGGPAYGFKAEEVRAAASSIKAAYLVELFAAFEGRLDEPLPGLDAILDDPAHPALVHFDAGTRREIVTALRGASVRRVAQMMIHGVGVSNPVYNAAANVTTAVLGGPEGLSARLRARFGAGAAVRRYMLAARDVHGDNEATAAFLGRVLERIATGELRGLRAETLVGIRDQLFLEVRADGARHLSKTGALDSDPMTRITSGIVEGPEGPLVYVVICERADPGTRERAAAADALEASSARLTRALLEIAGR